MDMQELLAQKNRLIRELNETNDAIARLNKENLKGKIKKVCDLLRELWESTDETFKIRDDEGAYLEVDFENLYDAIETQFGI